YVPRGKHTITISGPAYIEKTLAIDPVPGENNSYHVALEKRPLAYLSIFGNRVRNAKVKLGKKVICVAPCLKIQVPSGTHTLRISKKGMKSVTKKIILEKGDHKNFSVSLEKAPNRAGAITAYIVGLAAFGGGVYLGNLARTIKTDWDNKVESGVPVFSNDPSLKDAKIYYIGANVLFGLSAISLVIAVIRTFSESSPDSRIIQTVNMGTTSVSVSPFFAPGGTGLSFSVNY
ncbi:PEGA domain-containing protein, partial [Myxococcota bacterium]|nr:PEGA domain-containing protein [Myxococcota bacterium]